MKLSSAHQVRGWVFGLLAPCLVAAGVAGCGGGDTTTTVQSPATPPPAPQPVAPAASAGINAIAVGSLYIQDWDSFDEFYRVDLSAGTLTAQAIPPNRCLFSGASAVGPDGIAVGERRDGISQFDPVTTDCRALFRAPVPLAVLAVAPDGSYVAQDQAQSPSIYRFAASGAVISRGALSGALSMKGFAYAANGRLYGIGLASANDRRWYELDATTAVATQVATGVRGGDWGGVCIDSAGTAYTLEWAQAATVLHKYDAITGASRGSLTLQRGIAGAMICR